MPEQFINKFSVQGLKPEREQQFKAILSQVPGVERVDVNTTKQVFRIIGSRMFTRQEVGNVLSPHGFHTADLPADPQTQSADKQLKTLTVSITGMTCRSCEITVERKWKKLPGVIEVSADAAKRTARLTVNENSPNIEALQRAIGTEKYTVHLGAPKHPRPSFIRILGLFALVFVVGSIFSRLGLLKTSFNFGSGMNFGAIFIVGLIAASSSCVAIVGGLLLSAAAKFNETYAPSGRIGGMRPVALFVLGRIVGYTVLGGFLGVVGAALSPSTTTTAIIAILAAFYMLVVGLDMLGLAPSWLKGLLPRLPKRLSHKIMDAGGREHPFTPFLLGVGTFFLPCGFTQALQLYALTTGSFTAGASALLAFALGTAPALLALGWASSSLKGKAGKFFFQFSGALVVVLGFWNIQNGLAIAGYPISLPSWSSVVQANSDAENIAPLVDGVQVIKMSVDYGGYEPNHFTLRAGIPVRWEVDATNAGGCLGVLVSRGLGVQQVLNQGMNTIAFTPQTPGEVGFSCSMGMYRGSFTVVPQA